LVCGALFTTFIASSAAAFELDVDPRELDERIVLRDLAVKDQAYFQASDFCIRNGQLYLPGLQETKTKSDWSFRLRIRVLPGQSIEAETVPPGKKEEFNKDDIRQLLSNLREPFSLFSGSPTFCDDFKERRDRNVKFYKLTSIDGHKSLSSLLDDMKRRDYDFGKTGE
jgi:hypothetical protein